MNDDFKPKDQSFESETKIPTPNTDSNKTSTNPNVRVWAEPQRKKKLAFSKILILGITCSVVTGSFIGLGYSVASNFFQTTTSVSAKETTKTEPTTIQNISISSSNSPITNIYENVGPSVVSIINKFTVEDFFMREIEQEGQGSGVIFNKSDDSVLIVTNNHVVEGSEDLTIHLSTGENLPGTVIGTDPKTDLAVVKLLKKDMPEGLYESIKVSTFGNSDTLKIGEPAIAIGTPVSYENTVTSGIISGLNRKLRLSGRDLTLIQTDAAINPGNSGGALVNIAGEVIGINTVKVADTKIEGIGFAIPINAAKPIIDELVLNGSIERPYLGITGYDVTESLSETYGLPIGILVYDVLKNSPAELSGLQSKDVIIEFDGQKFPTMEQLKEIIQNHKINDSIEFTIVRNGTERLTLSTKLKSN